MLFKYAQVSSADVRWIMVQIVPVLNSDGKLQLVR
jgi:hypothetical protein